MRKLFLVAVAIVLAAGCVTKGKFKVVDKTEENKQIRTIEEPKQEETKKPEAQATPEKETVTVIPPKNEVTGENKVIVIPPKNEITGDGKTVLIPPIKDENKVTVKPVETFKKRKVVNNAFNVGEKLTFAIEYLGITAGIAVMEVKELVSIDGNVAYRIISTVKATPFFASLHRVDDTVESYIDRDGFYSLKLFKSLREGNYERDVTLYYDQAKKTVKEVEKKDEKVYNIPEYCQDILSSFYYFRTQKIEVGRPIIVDVYADGNSHKLMINVIKRERIKTPLGKYDAFAIKPFMKFESIFKQEGDVTIWCTADEKHIPVLMKSKVFVGSINAKLIDAVITK